MARAPTVKGLPVSFLRETRSLVTFRDSKALNHGSIFAWKATKDLPDEQHQGHVMISQIPGLVLLVKPEKVLPRIFWLSRAGAVSAPTFQNH